MKFAKWGVGRVADYDGGGWGKAFHDSALKYMTEPGFGIEHYLGPELTAQFGQAFTAARVMEAPVAILGPSITVACQTDGCVNHGIEVRISSEVIGNGRVVSRATWSHLACAACGNAPKELRRD